MLKYHIEGSTIHIETSALEAQIKTEGYTSGVAAGSFVDKATGARDVGFGLDIVDFLLEPGKAGAPSAAGQYECGCTGNKLSLRVADHAACSDPTRVRVAPESAVCDRLSHPRTRFSL